jgi:uncharacterized membrane protein
METPAAVTAPPASRMALAIFALLGLLVAGYMLAYTVGWIPAIACGEGGGCTRVQSSPWAVFMGVPVPAWGVIGYGVALGLAIVGLQPAHARDRRIALLLLAAGAGGFAFSAYLTWLEAFVIGSWCRWCIGSAVIATLMFGASLFEIPRVRRAS